MAAPSRLERLIKKLGEENLPSPPLQQPIAEAAEPQTPVLNGEVVTQSNEKQPADYHNNGQPPEDWWNYMPTKLPPAQVQATFTTTIEIEEDVSDDNAAPSQPRPALNSTSFSPLGAIAKFPYKFVRKEWLQPLATAFFDDNKIWNRAWDLYYIWSDHYPTPNPIVFVPEHQLLTLIDEINRKFQKARISITDELREEGLVIDFSDLQSSPDLLPCWLGHSTSRQQYSSWTGDLKMPYTGNFNDGRSLEAFKQKLELAAQAAKNKSKAQKAVKRGEVMVKRHNMVKSLQRTQQYLGLLGFSEESLLPDIAALSLSALDDSSLAPHPFNQDAIFIAFDVEAWERSPHPITEIGVATLDTRDLTKQVPGTFGENWYESVRARHFRIEEYKSYVNSDFVSGCPDKFDFGTSEFVSKVSTVPELVKCFKWPYSAAKVDSENEEERRNIILVGHDINADIGYFRQMGFDVLNIGGKIDVVDTAELYRVYTRDPNPRNLAHILSEFDITGWNLHNAGNDAVFTLFAMLAICVKAATELGSADKKNREEEDLKLRKESAKQQAEERILNDVEGWEDEEAGGVGIRSGEKAIAEKPENRGLYTSGGAILDVY